GLPFASHGLLQVELLTIVIFYLAVKFILYYTKFQLVAQKTVRIFAWNVRENIVRSKIMWGAATVLNSLQPIFAKPKTWNITTSASSISTFPLASRIMIRNLPYSTSESSLQKKFSDFGQIAEVKLAKDESTKRSKGYAFIQYNSQDDAMLALENMDHQEFDGRLIYVEIAKPAKDILGQYPVTCGPPKEPKKLHLEEHDELADCWY
ncbi:RRM_1 domain-containing protein, partial [Cephalotus follicularis]